MQLYLVEFWVRKVFNCKFKSARIIILFTAFIAIYTYTNACEYKNYYEAENGWSKQEPFLIQCISNNPAKDSVQLNRIIVYIKKKYPNILFFSNFIDLKTAIYNPKDKDKAPITRIITGGDHGIRGNIASFEKSLPSLQEIDWIFTSPAKDKIIKQLSKKRVVLLVINGPDSKTNKELLRCAKNGRTMVKDILQKKCSIIKTDLSDNKEIFLLNNIFLEAHEKKAGIFMIFGKGKGISFISNPEKENLILNAVEMLGKDTNAQSGNLWPRILLDIVF
ncbi:MAG: hypothetical protein ABIA63_04485 [bacterium]